MNKIKYLVVIAAAAVIAVSSPAFAKEMKIAHANLQRALNESDAGAKAKDLLEEAAKKLEDELNVEQEVLKKMKEEIDKMAAIWNKETRDAKDEEFRARSQAFQKKYVEYGEELNNKKQERENAIIEDLRVIVDEMAKKKGYSYVFERSMGGILYAPPSDDLTNEIIKTYNKSFAEKQKK
ncbi:MAG: hypothetical protein A3J24_07350 [Deltaproteobacteria bacterium RIFCSPLOWO2_02_FULL_53_8]|nr:MAG: hypothetical protein A3J24_07350 [Deltaproteobacteria bacterium RIFCSPLOWO2_02_FULL_53_8]